MNFRQTLAAAWQRNDSLLCVGLDPDPVKFPAHFAGQPDAIFRFCREIVDATADLVCSFKPQIAYFAAHRAEDQLEALIAHIHEKHSGIPVILDAKRGDIGSTAEQYAIEAFVRYGADAVTVNPYLGRDSVEPFLAHAGKGVILLCRTSNPGGSDLQFQPVRPDGTTLYEHVAQLVGEGGAGTHAGRRHAVAGAGHRRAGRRCRSHGEGGPHGGRQRPDDQFVARDPLRRQGRGFRRRGTQRGACHARRDQLLATLMR